MYIVLVNKGVILRLAKGKKLYSVCEFNEQLLLLKLNNAIVKNSFCTKQTN